MKETTVTFPSTGRTVTFSKPRRRTVTAGAHREVEEELERCDPLLALDRCIQQLVRGQLVQD